MSENFALTLYQWRGVWGERQTGTLQTGKGYCANLGHPEDETGLVYMRSRYYEPTTGRFISEDPARDGVNWYLYADGNPVNRVDQTGRESESDWFALGAIATAIAVLTEAYLAGIAKALKEVHRMLDILPMNLVAFMAGLSASAFALIGLYGFLRALGALPSEAKSVIALSVAAISSTLIREYIAGLSNLATLSRIAGGIGLTLSFAASAYMGITFAALLLTEP